MSWEATTPEGAAQLMMTIRDLMVGSKKAFFETHPTWGVGYEVELARRKAWTSPWEVTLRAWPEPHPAMPDELLT